MRKVRSYRTSLIMACYDVVVVKHVTGRVSVDGSSADRHSTTLSSSLHTMTTRQETTPFNWLAVWSDVCVNIINNSVILQKYNISSA